MAFNPDEIKALEAFWRKGRKAFVPLTGEEWETGCTLNQAGRAKLSRMGLVKRSSEKLGSQIYEITDAGMAVLLLAAQKEA